MLRTPAQTERLRAHDQHLKRGLLLYGPPGTGKTHTVRYLLSRLSECTVIVLAGMAMLRWLRTAAALAQRPGRVDFSVEIPRPDAECRDRLLRLYAGRALDLPDAGPLVAAAEGVTASFIKEWVRRSVLAGGALDEKVLRSTLTELLSQQQALTRSMLGAR
ncbi:AAA family ATPase [Actinophytocola sediminis]